MNDFKQAADELDAEISKAIAKIDQQAALIRELVVALAELRRVYATSNSALVRLEAWNQADSALSRVPEEYRG